jgi:hypothetical protein
MSKSACHFHSLPPSLIFLGKVGGYHVENLMRRHSNGKLLALPANITLEVANTNNYYETASITAIKSFIVHAPRLVYMSPIITLYSGDNGKKILCEIDPWGLYHKTY